MSRSPRGDGTIYLRKDGRYEVAVMGSDGRRFRAYARTKSDAAKLRRDLLARVDAGLTPLDSAMRLDRYIEVWLVEDAARRRRESTVAEYRRRLNSFVVPSLGSRRLRDLRDRDIERAMDAWRANGQARESIRGIQNALAAVLEDAVRRELLSRNVARSARLPEMAASPPIKPVTPDAVGRLLVEVVGNPIEPVVLLIAHTGCRIGEALGACWADIDLDDKSWSLRRTLTRTSTGGVRLGEVPKAGDARLLPLSDEVCAALRQQRREVASLRLAAGSLWQDLDLVFPSTIGTPIHPNNARTRFRTVAKRADFPASFHALRHFMVSVAAARGESIVTVAKLIGHKRVSTTEDLYTHLFDEDALRVTSAVSNAVNGLKAKALAEQKRRSEA